MKLLQNDIIYGIEKRLKLMRTLPILRFQKEAILTFSQSCLLHGKRLLKLKFLSKLDVHSSTLGRRFPLTRCLCSTCW